MIIESELLLRYAKLRTDTPSNGGLMSKDAVTSGARQNFLRDWTLAEVAAGATQYRKFFAHVANADAAALVQAGVHLLGPSSADDRITLFAGTSADTQSTLSAAPTEYGAGTLQTSVAAGATTLSVVLEDAGQTIFRTGDQICILGDGNEEYHDGVVVAKNAGVVTVTLASGDMLGHAYGAGAAVASVLPLGTIQATIGAPTKTTVAGTIDATKITPDAIGGIDQTVTLTLTSPTSFTVVSDVLGSLGAGTISAVCAPTNADFSRPYFTIAQTAFGGSWAAGEIVRFATVAAAKAVWIKGVLPAGAAPAGSDSFGLRVIGGSN